MRLKSLCALRNNCSVGWEIFLCAHMSNRRCTRHKDGCVRNLFYEIFSLLELVLEEENMCGVP
jgi:hypothetical protein